MVRSFVDNREENCLTFLFGVEIADRILFYYSFRYCFGEKDAMEIVAEEYGVFENSMTTEFYPAHVPKRSRTTFIFLVNRSYLRLLRLNCI